MVDKLTKMVHLAPCKHTITAEQVADIFFKEVVRLHGVPRYIVSDRDSKFTSDFWNSLWKNLGTKLKMSTSYHPQTDGQTEAMNKLVENMLRIYVNNNLNDWDTKLITVEMAINYAVQDSTGFSPYFLNYGQQPNFPLTFAAHHDTEVEEEKKEEANDIDDDHEGKVSGIRNDSNNPSKEKERLRAKAWVKRIDAGLEEAKRNLKFAQEMQKRQADKYRRKVNYKVGDQVFITTANMSSLSSKLRPKYIGPYPIKKVLSDLVVELDLPSSLEIHPRVHVDKIKLCNKSHDRYHFPNRQQINRQLAPLGKRKSKEFEVEDIINERKIGNSIQYLVRWKGWPIEDSTWESAKTLKNARALDYWEVKMRRKEAVSDIEEEDEEEDELKQEEEDDNNIYEVEQELEGKYEEDSKAEREEEENSNENDEYNNGVRRSKRIARMHMRNNMMKAKWKKKTAAADLNKLVHVQAKNEN